MERREDPLHYAREVVGKDPMATFLGIRVEEVRDGYSRCSLIVKPEYLNAVDRAHGIIVYSVVDQALAVAGNTQGRALALSITVNYISAAVVGETIVAEATPVHRGKKISVWKIQVRGKEGTLIASCEGIAYHK